jgi:hypothetical protein
LGLASVRLDGLAGNDSFVLAVLSPSIAVASARQSMRGTLLAVARLLQELGFDFIAPDETILPAVQPLAMESSLNLTFVPVFEARDNDEWPAAHNAEWAGLLGYNGANANGRNSGGFVSYASPPGFVHTSYNLLAPAPTYDVGRCNRTGDGPCSDVLAAHPEWFWPRNSPGTYGQLCWSEPSLITKLTAVVLDILRHDPTANIVSVSQNDNGEYCQTAAEAAIIAEEGSPMGPLLRAVNAIAAAVEVEFPHVALDTLAYQYTRAAPRLTAPRPNVIVRLCTIECNFALPLTDASNQRFQADMTAWAKISNRTYIWNYVTNFAAYAVRPLGRVVRCPLYDAAPFAESCIAHYCADAAAHLRSTLPAVPETS